MSLIYRAIWQDNAIDDIRGFAADRFIHWVSEKWPVIVVPTTGKAHGEGQQNGERVDLEVHTIAGADAEVGITEAYRGDLIETRSGGTRWHTTLRSWEALEQDDTANRWFWVDVEVVGDIDIARLAVAAPKLVRELLAGGRSPQVDGDALVPDRTVMTGAADGELLAELISRPGRTLPIIVANDSPAARAKAAESDLYYPKIVEAVRQRTFGIATTYTVDNAAGDGLIDALGRSYGVWDGAIRVYLADVDPAEPGNAWRHRYYTSDRYTRSNFVAGQAIARLLGPVSAVRRPPSSYPAVKRLLEDVDTGGSFDELLQLADDQLREADTTITELREHVKQQDEFIDDLAIDLGAALEERALALREIEDLRSHVVSLQGQLTAPDKFHTVVEEEQPPATAVSVTEAVSLARAYLADRLVIPEEALHDLDDLDASPAAAAWGQTSWEGLLALHAYAVDRADGWDGGGFWEWCENSKNPRAWRATNKKLAMKESEFVNNSPRLRRTREFPIATEIAPSGRIYMEPHLKIATGGGNLAPRIYFHFDDKQCIIHVGFIGPHRLLPNTKT
ncbi:hypothetical protein [Mycobacterium conspicuum]|jgi:hypothetical protein|uniref:Uncharacterized protein n=1 Tax=Mycobacterium conspicuum TaxID=44010 RepID=A0A1X1TQ98_9MYCO|nr:hypothetical protein [Mycobacterium conspicuum]ORV46716.1 hypothetical protein AWC00_03010 [Mycobacterium conspicuum]BBZ40274.1 hypothetical protein MCNS_33370 [Mycobacterium conspicuum]